MKEIPLVPVHTSDTTEKVPTDTDAYLETIAPYRTARGASEAGHDSPAGDVVSDAVRAIRTDIAPIFKGDPSELRNDGHHTLEEMKAYYWSRASHVGTEHGAKQGYELQDYFTVGDERSYEAIKDTIEGEYDEGTVTRNVLDGIEAYHGALDINPAHAATIMMEMLGRNLGVIKQRADEIERLTGNLPQEASVAAVAEFVNTAVPEHIAAIIETHGTGDDKIRSVMNKSSFYAAEHDKGAVGLTLAADDAAGLVEVYNIQSRPYDEIDLAMGNELAQIPEMQAAMLRVQEGLISFSETYLQMHPERAKGDMRNFSEIFVPEHKDGQMRLLPNPKLILAMVNNVMPAIAMSIMRRGGTLDSIDETDITEGVRIASGEFMLFQSRIGQIDHYDEETGTVQLESTFKVVCPAGGLFPAHMKEHLATYYEEAKAQSELIDIISD